MAPAASAAAESHDRASTARFSDADEPARTVRNPIKAPVSTPPPGCPPPSETATTLGAKFADATAIVKDQWSQEMKLHMEMVEGKLADDKVPPEQAVTEMLARIKAIAGSGA